MKKTCPRRKQQVSVRTPVRSPLTAARCIPLAAVALALAACGGDDDKGDQPATGSGKSVELRIVASDRSGERRESRIVCDENEDRPICRTALGLAGFLARAPDRERICTQIYGGPQTARITGTIDGRRIDRRLSRSDGCQIADWDRAQPLIPK